jgi:hypothetical protein
VEKASAQTTARSLCILNRSDDGRDLYLPSLLTLRACRRLPRQRILENHESRGGRARAACIEPLHVRADTHSV